MPTSIPLLRLWLQGSGREPEELGIGVELVSARNALAQIGVEVPITQEPAGPRKKDEGLPMPRRWTKHEGKEGVK